MPLPWPWTPCGAKQSHWALKLQFWFLPLHILNTSGPFTVTEEVTLWLCFSPCSPYLGGTESVPWARDGTVLPRSAPDSAGPTCQPWRSRTMPSSEGSPEVPPETLRRVVPKVCPQSQLPGMSQEEVPWHPVHTREPSWGAAGYVSGLKSGEVLH